MSLTYGIDWCSTVDTSMGLGNVAGIGQGNDTVAVLIAGCRRALGDIACARIALDERIGGRRNGEESSENGEGLHCDW